MKHSSISQATGHWRVIPTTMKYLGSIRAFALWIMQYPHLLTAVS
jgi:hypothetical protein